MKTKLPIFATAFLFLFTLFGIALFSLFSPDPEFVVSERRTATPLPTLSLESFADGDFSNDFENYLLDALPVRDGLRLYKNRFCRNILRLSDSDGCFLTENGVAKDLSPINKPLAEEAAATFDRILAKYFPEQEKVFLSVIPDKAYYARKKGERLDCDALQKILSEGMQTPHTDIDLTDTLSLFSYYATDIHWKIDTLSPSVKALAEAMDFTAPDATLLTKESLGSFVGTLGAQAALSNDTDTLTLLYDKEGVIASAKVYYPDGRVGSLYDKALFTESYDKYDVFLRGETVGGENARIANFFTRIESPLAKEERKLILFRDSFARSLLPYLVFSYSEIILVDLRAPTAFYRENEAYLRADDTTDILFLVSVHTLNSTEIR